MSELGSLDEGDDAYLRYHTRVRSLGPKELLQEVGSVCRNIYFVEKGLARIFYYHDGKDITEYFAFESDMIIRAESLFSGKPTPKGIEALEESVFISISADALFRSFDTLPRLERLFNRLWQGAWVESLQRLEQLQFHTAEERYLDLLQRAPEMVQRIPLKHLASYLGITQVSLSRIRSKIR